MTALDRSLDVAFIAGYASHRWGLVAPGADAAVTVGEPA
jgi:hypothetical protein